MMRSVTMVLSTVIQTKIRAGTLLKYDHTLSHQIRFKALNMLTSFRYGRKPPLTVFQDVYWSGD